jgi:hypothetical protein
MLSAWAMAVSKKEEMATEAAMANLFIKASRGRRS